MSKSDGMWKKHYPGLNPPTRAPNRSEYRLLRTQIFRPDVIRVSVLLRIVLRTVSHCCETRSQESLLNHLESLRDFWLDSLAWAIQNGLSVHCIERHLHKFDQKRIAEDSNGFVVVKSGSKELCLPIDFFAVERSCPILIGLLCTAGASHNVRMRPPKILVIALAIVSRKFEITGSTDGVIKLLAMDADPGQILKDLWQEPLNAPRKVQLKSAICINKWCAAEDREAFARTMNSMQRYSLQKSATLSKPTSETLQIAKAIAMMPLFEVPYQIIGQQEGTKTVIDSVVNLYMSGRNRLLVLLLTGPSGRGKTELARNMRSLLSLNSMFVDCARMKHETDVFGPQAPYHGCEEGFPLNNHLVEHAGQRSIAFLDEFDNTTEKVHKAMLLLFEDGWYHDRREANKHVDCSKTIWILAVNVGIEIVFKFRFGSLKDATEQKE